jgi:hypothetical protein
MSEKLSTAAASLHEQLELMKTRNSGKHNKNNTSQTQNLVFL